MIIIVNTVSPSLAVSKRSRGYNPFLGTLAAACMDHSEQLCLDVNARHYAAHLAGRLYEARASGQIFTDNSTLIQ